MSSTNSQDSGHRNDHFAKDITDTHNKVVEALGSVDSEDDDFDKRHATKNVMKQEKQESAAKGLSEGNNHTNNDEGTDDEPIMAKRQYNVAIQRAQEAFDRAHNHQPSESHHLNRKEIVHQSFINSNSQAKNPVANTDADHHDDEDIHEHGVSAALGAVGSAMSSARDMIGHPIDNIMDKVSGDDSATPTEENESSPMESMKNTMIEKKNEMKESINNKMDAASQKMQEMKELTREKSAELKNTVNSKTNELSAKAQNSLENTKDSADDLSESAKLKAEEMKKSAANKASELSAKAQNKMESAKETAASMSQTAAEKATELKNTMAAQAESLKDTVVEKVHQAENFMKAEMNVVSEKAAEIKDTAKEKIYNTWIYTKDSVNSMEQTAEDKAEELKKTVTNKSAELKDAAATKANELSVKAKDSYQSMSNNASYYEREANQKVSELKDSTQSKTMVAKAGELKDSLMIKAENLKDSMMETLSPTNKSSTVHDDSVRLDAETQQLRDRAAELRALTEDERDKRNSSFSIPSPKADNSSTFSAPSPRASMDSPKNSSMEFNKDAPTYDRAPSLGGFTGLNNELGGEGDGIRLAAMSQDFSEL